MDNKGFTLIELLATITILSLVVTISYFSIINIFNNSKNSAEKTFVKSLSGSLDEYIALNASGYSYTKCSESDGNCKNSNSKYFDCELMSCPVYYVSDAFDLGDLVNSKLVNSSELINPKNNKVCNNNSKVTVYRDSNYRYCFKMMMDCYVDDSNNKIEVTDCDFLK